MVAICHGVARHDGGAAFLRAQPVRIIDGHAVGYTGRYEVICPVCGDDPSLSFDQVPPGLQKIRGPSESAAGGLAAFHVHVGLADAAPTGAAVT
jgi:hypothetical protein